VSRQHPNVAKLREFNRWRRGGAGVQPMPAEVGEVIDWAIRVCEAADNLVNVKGRPHAELGYKRLEDAVNAAAADVDMAEAS
jgi:hypothetical protein